MAALFVYFELGALYAETLSLQQFEALTTEGPRRDAWDHYAPALSRIADDTTMERLAIVYSTAYTVVKNASIAAWAVTGSRSPVDAISPWSLQLRHARVSVEDAVRRVGKLARLTETRVDADLTGLASSYEDQEDQ